MIMVSQSSRVFYCIVLLGLGVGCSKSNDSAAPVGVRAEAPIAAAPAAPASVPESVKSESPAAPAPVKSPPPSPKPPGDPVIAALGQAMDTLNANNRLDCAVLSRHGVMSWDQCSSFQSVIDSGRTSRHRKSMLAAMKRHGYVKLKGTVVALVATNTYEVTARKKCPARSDTQRPGVIGCGFGILVTDGSPLNVGRHRPGLSTKKIEWAGPTPECEKPAQVSRLLRALNDWRVRSLERRCWIA